MKNYLSLAFVVLFVLNQCSSKRDVADQNLDFAEAQTDKPKTAVDPSAGVCIWKEIGVRDTPSEKGKYLTTVYLGEKVKLTSDTASESVKERIYSYQKVQLIDGTEGWIRKDFIANGVAGAISSVATIHKRPDMMTATDKKLSAKTFVVVKKHNVNGFSEVIGKPNGDAWFTSGWIPSDLVSTEEADALFSVLFTKANAIEDEAVRNAEIRKLLDNPTLKNSQFWYGVSEQYEESEGATEYDEEAGEVSEAGEIETDSTSIDQQ